MTPKQLAILGLCIALSEQALDTGAQGRIKNLMLKVKENSEKLMFILSILSPISKKCEAEAQEIIKRFAKETGWNHKSKHVATLASMLCELVDELPDKKEKRHLLNALIGLYDYYDRAKTAPAPSAWAGGLAAEKLRGCV